MVNPVNMQLAHWNLEHTAQQTRDPSAAAAQAGRQGEGLAAAEHRDTSVQQAEPSAEEERIGRKKRREEQEGKGRGGKRRGRREAVAPEQEKAPVSPVGNGKFDLYA